MSYIFRVLVCLISRAIFSLRYHVEVRGEELLNSDRLNRKGGVLFLPNHPAHMDPPASFMRLWAKYKMRPLIIEQVYNLSMMRPFNKLIRALPVPNFETAVNEWKIKRGERSIQEIAEGLKKRDNFILYPAGRLKVTGKEILGGASATHELLKECPDCNVVLIRATGFWGSSFSKAILGKSPDLPKTLLHGFIVLLKNFIFFAPRRKILVEIEPNPSDLPRENMSRIELNRYLEKWYNRYPDEAGNIQIIEPVKLVSYSFWKNEVLEPYQKAEKNGEKKGVPISDATRRKVYGEIKKILEHPELEIKPEMSLASDLAMDSLNISELIVFLSKNFSVAEVYPEDLESVGSVLKIAESGREKGGKSRPTVNFTFKEEKNRPEPMLPFGRTVAEAFLHSAQRLGHFEACGDDTVGVFSYQQLKKRALVLACHFKTFPEKNVAVMLPASVAAYLVILALELAGKTAIMLNWTLGSRYLEEMMQLSGAKKIISSFKFLDRLPNVQFGKCLDQLLLLEDIRKNLTLKMKLKGLVLSKCSPKIVMKMMGLNQVKEDDPCVVLFTSGTEAVPKGVPLSHQNILTNQRAGMQCIDLKSTDVVYGILPPFHSFGFSIAGLFPLLGGIRIAFYPDPTDSYALAEGIKRWKISLFCAAPSFLKGLFFAAKKEELQTVRFFVSGAEKAPNELFERVKELGNDAKLVEGYGITECSPILTINRPNLPPKGVGRLLPGVELITIHPETEKLLLKGETGEICVRGPNVFDGYLGNPRTPFIEIENKNWYRTGDLGHMEEDGTVVLSGRLKRFTKLGGEMISLGAIEEILTSELIKAGKISPDVPSIAVCADEKEEGKSSLVLFSVVDLEKDEVNRMLSESGLSNLVKISSVKKLDEIPLMGAGKTDYRMLQSLC